jgi:hypothetical protein
MKILMSIALVCALTGCSTYQAHSNLATPYAPTNPRQVQILYSPPPRPYTSIGIVSGDRYKPGWTDPTITDAVPQLQAAAAQIGADAVIIHGERSENDRHVVVEGEAIKFGSSTQP